MKQLICLILAVLLVLSLTACGAKKDGNAPAQTQNTSEGSAPAAPGGSQESTSAPAEPVEAEKAVDGVLTIRAADAAIVVNGTVVPKPYRLADLEAAGVPVDGSKKEINLSAGDFFVPNLYLDEEKDYLIIPSYYNGSDQSIKAADAGAGEITMSTYSSDPVDQKVSILGIAFGMLKNDVVELLGDPDWEEWDGMGWQVKSPETSEKGSLEIYFTSDVENGKVIQVMLSLVDE